MFEKFNVILLNLHFGTGLGQDAKNAREILAILYKDKGSARRDGQN